MALTGEEGAGGGDAAGAAATGPYPWRDLRLWAGAGLFAGLAAVANLAVGALLPGRIASTPGVAAAAAAVALGNLGVALHPRAARWTAEGHVLPLALPVVCAGILAPPVYGPRFLVFCFTLALLAAVWTKSAQLVRSAVRMALVLPADGSAGRGEMAPRAPVGPALRRSRTGRPQAAGRRAARRPVIRGSGPFSTLVGGATLDGLLAAAAVVAFCDLGAGPPAAARTALARTLAALAACACVLGLAAWTGRAQVLRRAESEEAGVQHGFSQLWWWAVLPAAALCLAAGVAVPLYAAPLQSGGVPRLILAFVDLWTGASGPPAAHAPSASQMRAQSTVAIAIAGACLIALVATWPLRRRWERALARSARGSQPWEEPIGFRDRVRLWWARLVDRWQGLWRRGPRPALRHGGWRPLSGSEAWQGRATAAPERREAAAGDARGRVRAAYGNLLGEARAAGLGRLASHTPRGFLGWILPRARPARFPLQSLTERYEVARYSLHPVGGEDAERAEGDARAAAYGVRVSVAERRKREGELPAEPALRWTAPRGFRRREW